TYQSPTLANNWQSYPDLPGMGGAFRPTNFGLYGYGHHNPATRADPNGEFVQAAVLACFTPVGAVVCGVIVVGAAGYAYYHTNPAAKRSLDAAVAAIANSGGEGDRPVSPLPPVGGNPTTPDPEKDPNAASQQRTTTASSRDTVVRGPNKEILRVRGEIRPSDIGTGPPTNASSREWARQLGQLADDAGHTRGANLGGSGGKDFVWPQNPTVNRGIFRDFEGRIAQYVRSTGQSVDF